MNPADLHSFAETAITMAGLTGIISAIQNRNLQGLRDREKAHLGTMLIATVFVVLVAFIPSWIERYPDATLDIWELSVRVILVAHIGAFLAFFLISRWAIVLFTEIDGLERVVSIFFVVYGLVAVVIEALVVFGPFAEYAAFVYQGVIHGFLGLGLFNFIALLSGHQPQQKQMKVSDPGPR